MLEPMAVNQHFCCWEGQDENEIYSKANIVLGKVCEYLYDN